MKTSPGTIDVTLPDGSCRTFDAPVTGADVAASIGSGLARAAWAVKVDGDLRDLGREIDHDAVIEIVTSKSSEALELLRHDAAHVLAQAAKELFPEVQVTIGPVIDDGFYYDFARDDPFTPADMEAIEARMMEIVDRDEPISREVWDRDEAARFFESIGEAYKAEIIRDLPADETITLYRQGDWIDLCRGPHLPSTGRLPKAFRLTRLAGAYWRGDSRNAMLQRIYGTAWSDKAQLKAWTDRLEEAAKRDHRRLGREMDLFHFQDEAVGSAFWHASGWRLYRTLQDYMRRRLEDAGYQEVNTPQCDAAAHLRHGLVRQGATEGLDGPPRGGRKARPPAPRARDGSLPFPGRGGRFGLLARLRVAPLPHPPGLHAPSPRGRRLPGSQHAANGGAIAVGGFRSLGEVPRQHVHGDHRGRTHLGREADELSLPRADLPPGSEELP